jgi:hypothetical protein
MSFGPDALRVIFTAYDAAWSEIAPKLSADPVAVERARMALATIVLGLANASAIGPDGLRTIAVAVFSHKHGLR